MTAHTDKKEKKIFLIYKEIQTGAVAKSYMRKGFLIYEEMHKYLVIYEEAVAVFSQGTGTYKLLSINNTSTPAQCTMHMQSRARRMQ